MKYYLVNMYVYAFATILFVCMAPIVSAASTPQFFHCLNPQGPVIATYSSGIHGVAGDSTSYSGSDVVYHLSGDDYVQCLCSTSGEGIQTNWWKIADINDPDVNYFTQVGWVSIPDGSAWGLAHGQYLAYNKNYSCIGGAGGGSTNTSTTTSTSASSQSSSASSSVSLTALAGTGTLEIIFGCLIAGYLFLLTGLAVTKRRI